MEPVIALIIGIVLIILFSLFFWPRKGILAKWQRSVLSSQRARVEDALKHLYDSEYNNVSSSINSIAGNLSITANKSAKLVSSLESMGLLNSTDKGLELTSEGRSYALRVIRVHRLWERFLADETGVDAIDWHNEAELIEHRLSPDEADQLAARIGNPIIDPHGDPIPTSMGSMPEKRGIPITSLKEGKFAKIFHIEDEPEEIYQQIIALGLYPGMQVRIIDSSKDRIRFEADGELCILAPLFAKNISVVQFKKEEKVQESFKTLASLKIGESGKVIGISSACRGQQRRRLLDFGVIPGTVIRADLISVGEDPVAYNIRGASIALRKKQSELIFIQPESEKY